MALLACPAVFSQEALLDKPEVPPKQRLPFIHGRSEFQEAGYSSRVFQGSFRFSYHRSQLFLASEGGGMN